MIILLVSAINVLRHLNRKKNDEHEASITFKMKQEWVTECEVKLETENQLL